MIGKCRTLASVVALLLSPLRRQSSMNVGADRHRLQPNSKRRDYEFEALLEEYKAHRAEMVSRLESQQQLINYTFVITAAGVPLLASAVERGMEVALLSVPIIYVLIGWTYVGMIEMIGLNGEYIHNYLRPRLNGIVSDRDLHLVEDSIEQGVINWEFFRSGRFPSAPRSVMADARVAGKAVLLTAPSIGAVIVFLLVRGGVVLGGLGERALFWLDIGILVAWVFGGIGVLVRGRKRP